MYDRPLTIEQVLAALPEAPAHIAAVTAGLTPTQLRARPGPADWSLNDILAHLRACSDMWGGYIAKLLAEDKPTFRAVNPTTWIKQTNYPELEFRRSLRAYARQRSKLLAVLQPLPPKAWSRSATVTGEGKPRERTVFSYAQWLVNHERSHFKQVQRLVEALSR